MKYRACFPVLLAVALAVSACDDKPAKPPAGQAAVKQDAAAAQPSGPADTKLGVTGSDWELRYKGLYRKDYNPVTMELQKRGQIVTGFATYQYGVQPPERHEVKGEINADGSFSIAEDMRIVWKGTVDASGALSGNRDLPGPDGYNFKNSVNNFLLKRIQVLSPGTVAGVMPLTPTTSDLPKFLQRLKAGVKQRDRTALRALMHPLFTARNFDPGADAWIKGMADATDQPWEELERALHTAPRAIDPSPLGRPQMEVYRKSACSGCRYGISLLFERGDDQHWRWTSLDAPGD